MARHTAKVIFRGERMRFSKILSVSAILLGTKESGQSEKAETEDIKESQFALIATQVFPLLPKIINIAPSVEQI